ncbi:MAG: phosphoadenosine phosphosulfate reductase family protein [Thermoplasmata archaeon]
MKIYLEKNVYDAALERLDFIFTEFDNVCVSISGGKDSTVLFNLALKVAKQKNKLPLNVLWIDQEFEWQATVDFNKKILYRNDVRPFWLQIPLHLTNNSTLFNRFIICWDEKYRGSWIREKDDISIKENIYGIRRFKSCFKGFLTKTFKGKSCLISGMRAEENFKRFLALTQSAGYKGITYCKKEKITQNGEYYTFYPLYDWTYEDIWKAIVDNGWEYNRIYDYFYMYNKEKKRIRVSSLIHETAKHDLMVIQEIEPDTWEKFLRRIDCVDAINQMGWDAIRCPDELPEVFSNWREYIEFLNEKLVVDNKNKRKVLFLLEKIEKEFSKYENYLLEGYKVIVNTILASDWDLTIFNNYYASTRRKIIGCQYIKIKEEEEDG